jgi:hypothetical protein
MIPSQTIPVVEISGPTGMLGPFPITFPTFEPEDVEVAVIDEDGIETSLTVGYDYVLSKVGIPNTYASLTLINDSQGFITGGELVSGYTLKIKFTTQASQPAKFRDLGRFAPEAFEKALDRVVMSSLAISNKVSESYADVEDLKVAAAALDVRVDAIEMRIVPTISHKNVNFNAQYSFIYVVEEGVISAQLPAPEANANIQFKLNGSGPLTLLRNGTEKIDFVEANKVMSSAYMSFSLVSDGNDWFIV